MTATTDSPTYVNPAAVAAKAMRAALKAEFAGIKFSVRVGRGTAALWLDIQWTDGPTNGQVEHIARRVQRDYLTVQRKYSAEATEWARQSVATDRERYGTSQYHHSSDPQNLTEPDYFATRRLLAAVDLSPDAE